MGGEFGLRRVLGLADLVDGAMKMTRLWANNPRQVSTEDARAILEKAL
jgi:alcohol dehydrogenase class IV